MDARPIVLQRAQLSWTSGAEDMSLDIEATDTPWLIGRTVAAAVYLTSHRVSRSHAEIRFDQGHWVLRDLKSRNGTRVGDRTIRGDTVVLGDSEVLRCGDVVLRFTVERAAGNTSQATTVDEDPYPALTVGDLALLRELCAPPGLHAPTADAVVIASPTNAELAERLHLTEDGVRQRLKRLYARFELEGPSRDKRAELIRRVVVSGVLELNP